MNFIKRHFKNKEKQTEHYERLEALIVKQNKLLLEIKYNTIKTKRRTLK
jgi:hypothetical protein